jgi:hypothetical protein
VANEKTAGSSGYCARTLFALHGLHLFFLLSELKFESGSMFFGERERESFGPLSLVVLPSIAGLPGCFACQDGDERALM